MSPAVLQRVDANHASLVVEFQDRLHDALQSFVNGDFIIWGSDRRALLRPLRLERCRVPWDALRGAVHALDAVGPTGNGLGARGETLVAEGRSRTWLTFRDAATLLSALLGALDRLVGPGHPDAEEAVEVLRTYEGQGYRDRGLGAVDRLAAFVRRTLAPYLHGFYLHGSLSTLDDTAFSDVDDFVIIRREVATNPDALQQCAAACVAAARFLYEHDPWQHHRHYVVSEIDLRWYAPVYLPPQVLRFATAILGPQRLAIAARGSATADRAVARALAQELVLNAEREVSNLWRLKWVVSGVLLLPALYLASRGAHCYKKFSFEHARPAFGAAWEAVTLASEIRSRWNFSPSPTERMLRLAALDGLGNPILFQHAMIRWAQPLPPSLLAWQREEGFLIKVAVLGRWALELLEAGSHEA
jgi:hypothetical protein